MSGDLRHGMLAVGAFPQKPSFFSLSCAARPVSVPPVPHRLTASLPAFCPSAKCVVNRHEYFAARIYKSMKGMGTNDRALIRNIVSRCEVRCLPAMPMLPCVPRAAFSAHGGCCSSAFFSVTRMLLPCRLTWSRSRRRFSACTASPWLRGSRCVPARPEIAARNRRSTLPPATAALFDTRRMASHVPFPSAALQGDTGGAYKKCLLALIGDL